jgi:uncharacterized protein (TIGR00369 family)
VTKQAPKTGIPPRDVLLSYDGLGFLQAIVDGTLPQPPIAELLGFRLIGVEHGNVVFEGIPEFRHYNPIGVVHAGFAATLLDSAVACSVHSTLAKGETYTTLELKLNLVRALTEEAGPVRAEGRIIHRGRTTATAEGQLRDRAGRLYAHASTTCMIFPAKD